MQLQVAAEGGIQYGCVKNFLLEKSRIVTQAADERGYHIFYQLLKGASASERQLWKLKSIDEYCYLNSKCLEAAGIVRSCCFNAVVVEPEIVVLWCVAFSSLHRMMFKIGVS